MLTRELPYGESSRSTKRTLYRITDPALRFWFSVYSPHRSRWRGYPVGTKRGLIHAHAASVFEDWCRGLHAGAARYWEPNVEIDLVCPDPGDPDRLLVGAVKWKRLGKRERQEIQRDLAARWHRSRMAARHPGVRFEVFDATCL